MPHRRKWNRTMTRRDAIRAVAADAVAAIGGASLIRGGHAEPAKSQPASSDTVRTSGGGAIRLERQATGSEVWQVTTEKVGQSNIYCEVPYCSGDSRYFVYERRLADRTAKNRTELMVVELGTWEQRRLDLCAGMTGGAISPAGILYYLKRSDDGSVNLMRADLAKREPAKVCRLEGTDRFKSLGTVTTDGRFYACGVGLDDQYKMFGVLLVALPDGNQKIIDRDPFILNPHPQFEPGEGAQLMIQHNRGGSYKPDGTLERLVGPEGATLYLLSIADGKRTELQVGKPYTTPATGHEAWIGASKEILLTVSASGDFAADKGNLLAEAAGRPARVVAKGYRFGHVGVSRCGRLFSCDDVQGQCKVVIGSIRTGKSAVVCEARTSMGRAQNTHAHPYLTPDLKWVIFNSDRSGWPHIHAASVPEGMVEELLRE